jgi:hypothetical protein
MALVTLHTKYFDAIIALLSQIIFAGFYFVLKKKQRLFPQVLLTTDLNNGDATCFLRDKQVDESDLHIQLILNF